MDFSSSIFLPDEPLVCEEMMERKRQGKISDENPLGFSQVVCTVWVGMKSNIGENEEENQPQKKKQEQT